MNELYNNFLNTIISWQQTLNTTFSSYFDQLQSGDNSMYIYILGVAFTYGLVHALGPGHGKMVIASYFLVKGAKTQEALKAGFLTAIIHTISALSITGVLFIFFQTTIMQYFQEINTNMYKVSAIFIIFIALFLLFETIKDRNLKEELPSSSKVKNKNILSIALTIGIVPCPGVMTIVLFSMILGYVYLGILSAVVMSIGMGITISLAAIVTTKIQKQNQSNRYKNLFQYLSYFGIAILLTLGITLLV